MRFFAFSCIVGGILAQTALGEQGLFMSKTVIIPKNPALEKKGLGEDSADVSPDNKLIAIADGVGSWVKKGIDSGIFARKLTSSVVEAHGNENGYNARQLLVHGCDMATQATTGGTSTAVVLKLKPGMKLETSNLGDSGYILYHIN